MTTLDFSQRSHDPELMDTVPSSFEEFRDCLRDLAFVNRCTLAYRPTEQFFEALLLRNRYLHRPLEVLDVGSGYGDTLRHIAHWAKRRGVRVNLTGIDLNPWSRKAASQATLDTQPISWITKDVFAYAPAQPVDVVISSLFTHHLDDEGVVTFLRWMEKTARLGWFVNDLHRHALPYHVFRSASSALRLHRFVQHDGPVSIARAFSSKNWTLLLRQAEVNIDNVDIAWRFPFRLTLERFRSA
jgi:SAM-dependent methyltransferase